MPRLRDRNVFVRDWTPYAERADTYLDATAVVSLHHAHIETRFSFRTRLLDSIWSATPIICTAGDVLAPVVREEQIGITVAAGDIEAVVDAVRVLATDRERVEDMRSRLRALASQYHWDVAAAPLVDWCGSPSRLEERFLVPASIPRSTSCPLSRSRGSASRRSSRARSANTCWDPSSAGCSSPERSPRGNDERLRVTERGSRPLRQARTCDQVDGRIADPPVSRYRPARTWKRYQRSCSSSTCRPVWSISLGER